MKYEITKGSEKDFEGAPEWAMVRDKSNVAEYFSSGLDKGCKFVEVGDSSGKVYEFMGKYPNTKIIAERRPITEPVVNQQLTAEWDGEGLPPVGAECEIKRAIDWLPVTIRFISYYHTIFKMPEGQELCYQTCALQFRPIRPPEDVARDEATKAMNEVWREHAGKEHNGKLFSIYEIIYEGIAAGKIPGVKLE